MSVFFIAEAGVNHNGCVERALELVRIAASAGADAVKFQTFRADAVAAQSAPKAAYQKRETGTSEGQLAMLRALELSDAAFVRIADECTRVGIEFMSTPFDYDSLRFLADDVKVKRLKCPSGEITNGPFLLAMAQTGLPIIISTGMATLDEIADALAVLAFGYAFKRSPTGLAEVRAFAATPDAKALLRDKVMVLHCTSAYPAPVGDLNLRALRTIADTFGLPVGYSDHSEGLHVGVAAAALGAVCLEKHFTIDRTLPGPDHKASLEPGELATMVRHVRDVTQALGSPDKAPTTSERDTRSVARRSLVAGQDIAAGTPFADVVLTALRPGGGASPMAYWDLKHSNATRSYHATEAIDGTAVS
jgi:N-acetylneuraminate synthase